MAEAWAVKFTDQADSLESGFKQLLLSRSGLVETMHTLNVPFSALGGFELSAAGLQTLLSRPASWGAGDDQSLIDLQAIVKQMVKALRGAADGSREVLVAKGTGAGDDQMYIKNSPSDEFTVDLKNGALTLLKGDVPSHGTGMLGGLPLIAIAGLALAGLAMPMALVYLATTLVKQIPVVVDKIATAFIEHKAFECLSNGKVDPETCLKMVKALEDKNVNGKLAEKKLEEEKNKPWIETVNLLSTALVVTGISLGVYGSYRILKQLKVINGHVEPKSNSIETTLSNIR